MQKNYKGVSIIIPTFNGKELLQRFLPSVMKAAKSYKGESEIIIVDDGGIDGSDEFIKSNFPEVHLIKLGKNRGFAGACNEGFRESKNQIIILLNNDVLVTKDFISPLIPHFEDKDVFGVRPGLRLLNSDTNEDELNEFSIGLKFKKGFIELPMSKLRKAQHQNFIFLLGGTSAAFSKDKLLELGGFDELFSPFYWEDADLSYRAWKRRWKILYEPKSLVYHQTHSTILKTYPEHYIERIGERNRYIMVWKNIFDWRMMFTHILFIPLRLSVSLVTGNWWRLRAFLSALKRIRQVRRQRKVEKHECRISDREIFTLFTNIMKGSESFLGKQK